MIKKLERFQEQLSQIDPAQLQNYHVTKKGDEFQLVPRGERGETAQHINELAGLINDAASRNVDCTRLNQGLITILTAGKKPENDKIETVFRKLVSNQFHMQNERLEGLLVSLGELSDASGSDAKKGVAQLVQELQTLVQEHRALPTPFVREDNHYEEFQGKVDALLLKVCENAKDPRLRPYIKPHLGKLLTSFDEINLHTHAVDFVSLLTLKALAAKDRDLIKLMDAVEQFQNNPMQNYEKLRSVSAAFLQKNPGFLETSEGKDWPK